MDSDYAGLCRSFGPSGRQARLSRQGKAGVALGDVLFPQSGVGRQKGGQLLLMGVMLLLQ